MTFKSSSILQFHPLIRWLF